MKWKQIKPHRKQSTLHLNQYITLACLSCPRPLKSITRFIDWQPYNIKCLLYLQRPVMCTMH